MRSAPLLFFALAVAGALIGIFDVLASVMPATFSVMAGKPGIHAFLIFVLGLGVASFLFRAPRVARALLVSLTIIAIFATLASHQKQTFDNVLASLPPNSTILEGELTDLSDTLNAEKVGTLETTNFTLVLRLKDAASAKSLRIGDRVRVKGKIFKAAPSLSPGQLDGYLFGLARNVHGRMIVSNPNHIANMQNKDGPSFMASIKQSLRDHLNSVLTPREAGLMLALVVSDLKLFDDEQRTVYRNIGAGHLLGVSGLQVSLLSVIFLRVLLFLFLLIPFVSRRSWARYPTLIVTLSLIWGFVILCGSPPPAFRAGMMTTLMLLASLRAWPTTSADLFGATGLICLLYEPAWVVDPSFWLSFGAVFGLIIAAEYAKIPEDEVLLLRLEKSNVPLRRKWRSVVLTSLGAGLLTLPLSIYYFAEISLSGLAVNLFLVPIAGILQTPAILFAGFGAILSLPFLTQIGAFLVAVLEAICMTLDDLVGRSYPMMPLTFAELLIAALACVMLIMLARSSRRVLKAVILLSCVLFLAAPSFESDESMTVTFLPVGQGDGAVLQIPPGKVMVIDGGGNFENVYNPGERVIAPFLKRRGIDTIDVVVLSHPDADHVMGLIWLVENFDVRELWHSDFDATHPLMARLSLAAFKKGVKVRSKDELPETIGDAKLAYFFAESESKELRSTNNRSLVMRVSYENWSVLFPGDVEAPLEEALLGQDLSATIVKAPHHGSKGSSTQAFVDATKAAHLVFCTGVNNRFGFPHSQSIKRWQDSGAKLWDTAVNGELAFRLNGRFVEVKPFRPTL